MTSTPDEADEPGALRPGSSEVSARHWGRGLPLLIALAVLAGFAGLLLAVTISRGGGARESATAFMVNVRTADYDDAHDMLCDQAKDAFPDPGALREGLGLVGLTVTGFDVGDTVQVDDDTSRVPVRIDLAAGEKTTMLLTVVQDDGRYLICGF